MVAKNSLSDFKRMSGLTPSQGPVLGMVLPAGRYTLMEHVASDTFQIESTFKDFQRKKWAELADAHAKLHGLTKKDKHKMLSDIYMGSSETGMAPKIPQKLLLGGDKDESLELPNLGNNVPGVMGLLKVIHQAHVDLHAKDHDPATKGMADSTREYIHSILARTGESGYKPSPAHHWTKPTGTKEANAKEAAQSESDEAPQSEAKWMKKAFGKNKGALHAELGIPKDEKIPTAELEKAAKKGGKEGKRAQAALNAREATENAPAWSAYEGVEKPANEVDAFTAQQQQKHFEFLKKKKVGTPPAPVMK